MINRLNPLFALVLIFSILYALLRKVYLSLSRQKFSSKHGCKPALRLPQRERLIGFDLLKEQMLAAKNHKLLEAMSNRSAKYGNTYTATMMGQSYIVTNEPENLKAVLAMNFQDFGLRGRKESFGPLLGNGIFTSDGMSWKHSRALIRPSFVKAQVSNFDIFENHIQSLISLLPRDFSTVDLQPLFFRLTLDSATEYLFGESVDSLHVHDGSQETFASAFDYASSEIPKRYRMGPFVAMYRNRRFFESCKLLHDFVDGFVEKALTETTKGGEQTEDKGRYVFLYELAKSTRDPIQLRAEVMSILLAGRDSTASLLSLVFFTLARNPRVFAKLRREVDELGGKIPDYEMLRQMRYLKGILNEVLRLYPVVPNNSRYALRDTMLPCGGGPDGKSPVFVARGQIVTYCVYDLHRRRDLYGADADQFCPERWESLRPGWAYLPFNGGPRVCIGQQFALMEVSYMVVRILQTFRGLESRDTEEWKENLSATLSSLNGVKVAFSV
ncbi:Cytochrome P450 monooxygenase [Lachnellula willkommii]|uniref:Cytochrome P450 monooxygenase n=1 Tax=Lachnellula willkommii TaxID=215461 RepID=A0A559MJG7_9HELO|nr:Cytochrome P450 monooxygenase [Lachnellula willkommii]